MSPGFFLTDLDESTLQPKQEIIKELDVTGQGAVKSPSGPTIAAHGDVSTGAGLGLIVIALLGQWLS
jgi:hypothetical protein